MLFDSAGQSAAFLLMLACGLKIGLAYDFLRLLRRLFRPGLILTLTLDLLFGAATAGLLIASLLAALDGELRLYALMGALAGFLLYGATLSRLLSLLAVSAGRLRRPALSWLARRAFVKKCLR